MTAPTPFSAADAALGYLYQVRVALVWSLRRLKNDSHFAVSLETLDDVTFESKGTPDELLQTKHHQAHATNLTDASPDLWKSLRVWCDAWASGAILPSTTLYLLTTATAGDDSAASRLRSHGRDIESALSALLATAQTSSNKDNAAAYTAFLTLKPTERRRMLEAVVIVDAQPAIADVDHELRAEVFWAVERKHQDAFLERIEGWWLRRVLHQLTRIGSGDRILAAELEAQMSDLRDQFKHDALPIDDDLLDFTLDDATFVAQSESRFVRQLDLVKAGKRRVVAAVRDYYRAFEQRSRWLRDDLLLVGDLAAYERRLEEEWELIFEGMKDELGADVAEDAKQTSARQVLAWAERATIPIRPAVTEPFVTRGSLHMLADEVRIGWHPDFRERLARVLTGGNGGDA